MNSMMGWMCGTRREERENDDCGRQIERGKKEERCYTDSTLWPRATLNRDDRIYRGREIGKDMTANTAALCFQSVFNGFSAQINCILNVFPPTSEDRGKNNIISSHPICRWSSLQFEVFSRGGRGDVFLTMR